MDKQYIFIVVVLAIIFIYYYDKNKQLTGKDSVIDQFIELIVDLLKRVFTSKLSKTKIWTYIEPISFEKSIHLLENDEIISDYFRMCIERMKQLHPNLVILTPETIPEYIDDFPFKMGKTSHIPLRERVDLLFSFILEKYGGLCISPGTVIINIDELISKSNKQDIVTVGSSPEIFGFTNDNLTPNTYVIGGKKGSSFLKLYKQTLLRNYTQKNKQLTDIKSYEVISSLLKYKKPSHFHVTSLSDGTYDSNLRKIDITRFVSTNEIKYKNPPYLLSIPYENLFDKKYYWFLTMSKKELLESNIVLIKYLT